ncbi:translation elongation factor-like protein [Candidatus Bathyarchaeota archaeon]|nr:translation elongation factor-like protein [Candidatus Bathyarchaeota archaeon]MCK4435366.1 translation elongation factor-like protein [Candidatus Bathyarchaeota archaeon]TET57861.1 MAG: translation elongation factor-like protein [Candidatus Bathyarchaeota archaeon]
MGESQLKEVGRVTHYFSKIGVAVLELSDKLSVGDRILIRGMTTNVEQTVDSMQIDRVDIESAEAGKSVGLKVEDRVREGDSVYKILQ